MSQNRKSIKISQTECIQILITKTFQIHPSEAPRLDPGGEHLPAQEVLVLVPVQAGKVHDCNQIPGLSG
jgi:hypothetical protein